MTLDFSSDIPMFLFKGWDATGGGKYFLTILFCMILAISIELVNFIRWYMKDKTKSNMNQSSLHINKSEFDQSKTKTKQFWPHLFDSFLQLIVKTSTYLLMLAVMTYNFGLIFLVSLAYSLSNFAFNMIKDWDYISERLENKHQYEKIGEVSCSFPNH
jgi:hypothetical protein